MGIYSIKDIEMLSGVKAHTLRIWEQRYNLVEPQRTDTNIRYYTDAQLRYLMNVSYLIENGWKISKISAIPKDEVGQKVLDIDESQFESHAKVKELTKAMITLDVPYFEKIFADSVLHLGAELTFINLIIPFLQKIGVFWTTGTIKPAHEHFVSNLIRQKLITAIDGLRNYRCDSARRFLLFLPEGETHEFSLLLVHYLLKSRGHEVIYIGANVPFEDLRVIVFDSKPDFLVSVFTMRPTKGVDALITQLTETFPETKLLVSGNAALEAKPTNHKCQLFQTLNETVDYFDQL